MKKIIYIVKTLSKIINKTFNTAKRLVLYISFRSQFKSYLKHLKRSCKEKLGSGENAYISKWKRISYFVEPYSYRLYSYYCGDNPNIIPEDIGRSIIEECLNPREYRLTYEDKNMFPILVGKQNLPKTILYRINGGAILTSDNELGNEHNLMDLADNLQELILKPTVGTCSGIGVEKYVRKDDGFYNVNDNTKLSLSYLMNYNDDFCLQEAIEQSQQLSSLNSSSVNTIRLALYRSVKTEDVIVTAGIIRVGRNGSFIDNAHGGGRFIGININDGKLAKTTLDQYGNANNVWNGIDYSSNEFEIPNWSEVISFAKYVGKCIHHHRFIALDIALNNNNKPILIEYNVSNFSYWLFLFTNQLPLGEYTDEVIEYCKKRKKEILF